MRFAGIDIPTELVQAQAEGQVVFFVGAGASASAPTCLPMFDELTKTVAALSAHPEPSRGDLSDPDVFLGKLERDRVAVHVLVAQEIGKATERNSNHEALAALAAHPRPARLVTTNYDDFLSQALKAQGRDITEFKAPALPLGDDFEGIVYLHGHLGQDPKQLVVTDADFGRAYISRHWAADFLRELFSKFIVCFVGYSHNDHLMEYFARGMGSDAKPRYIFTEQANADEMRERDLIPIVYPDKGYDTLSTALTSWGSYAGSSPLTRAQRIRRLAGITLPTDPDDQDFLASAVNDSRLVAEVCSIATSPGWFEWLVGQPGFCQVLEPLRGQPNVIAGALGDWFARRVTADEDTMRAGLKLLTETPSSFSSLIAYEIARELGGNASMLQSIRQTWLLWCINSGASDPQMFEWLNLVWGSVDRGTGTCPLDEEHTWMLFDTLARQGFVPSKYTLRFGSPRSRGLGNEDYWFLEGIEARLNMITPRLREWILGWFPGFFHFVEVKTTRSFWSYQVNRVSDDPSPRDFAPNTLQVLCSLVSRAILRELAEQPARAVSRAQVWLGDPSPIVHRFGLFALQKCHLPADGKCALLLAAGLLGNSWASQELYDLLAVIVPTVSSTNLMTLVEAIRLPGEMSEGGETRRTFELLSWIVSRRKRSAQKALAQANEKLRQIACCYPEWATQENSGPVTSGGGVSTESLMPWTPEEFHQMVGGDSRQAVADLFGAVRRGEPNFPGYRSAGSWFGPGQMVTETTKFNPRDGLAIWDATDGADATIEERRELRGHVVQGWCEATLDESTVGLVFDRLSREDETQPWRAVTDFLASSRHGGVGERWAEDARARKLALLAFPHVKDQESSISGGDVDLMNLAINSPVGNLAFFWVAAARADARAGTYPRGLLSDEVAAALEELIHAPKNGYMAQAVFMSSLQLLNQIDPDWTKKRLLTWLDPEREWDQVLPLWGAVFYGRWDDDLLGTRVRGWLIDLAGSGRSQDLGRPETLVYWLSSITVYATADRESRLTWMMKLSAVSDQDLKAKWLEDIGRLLKDLDLSALRSAWETWGKEYVDHRVNKQPIPLTSEEVGALLHWATLLEGSQLKELADALERTDCGLSRDTFVPHCGAAVRLNADIWASLLDDLLSKTKDTAGTWPPIWHFVEEALEALIESDASPSHIQSIKDSAFRLGFRFRSL